MGLTGQNQGGSDLFYSNVVECPVKFASFYLFAFKFLDNILSIMLIISSLIQTYNVHTKYCWYYDWISCGFSLFNFLLLQLEGEEIFKNACVSVCPRAVKCNIVSNNIGLRQKCDFFCLRLEICCLGKFVERIKIFSLSWNLALRLIQIHRIEWWCSIFLIPSGNNLFFLANLVQKSKLSV